MTAMTLVPTGSGRKLLLRTMGNGPRLIFAHGTGLACDGFGPFLMALSVQFEVILCDLPGHGINWDWPEIGLAEVGDVLAEVVTAVDPVAGIFHSMSGVLAIRAALRQTFPLKAMIAYEPPLARDGADAHMAMADRQAMAARALRRQRRFTDPSVLAHRWAKQGLGGPQAGLLADSLLRRDGDDWVLRCSPKQESRIFGENESFDIWSAARDIDFPLAIMAGRRLDGKDYVARVAPDLAAAGGYDFLQFEGLGHLGLIEAPDRCATIALAWLQGVI